MKLDQKCEVYEEFCALDMLAYLIRNNLLCVMEHTTLVQTKV